MQPACKSWAWRLGGTALRLQNGCRPNLTMQASAPVTAPAPPVSAGAPPPAAAPTVAAHGAYVTVTVVPEPDHMANFVRICWRDASSTEPDGCSTTDLLYPIDNSVPANNVFPLGIGSGALPRSGSWLFAVLPGGRQARRRTVRLQSCCPTCRPEAALHSYPSAHLPCPAALPRPAPQPPSAWTAPAPPCSPTARRRWSTLPPQWWWASRCPPPLTALSAPALPSRSQQPLASTAPPRPTPWKCTALPMPRRRWPCWAPLPPLPSAPSRWRRLPSILPS